MVLPDGSVAVLLINERAGDGYNDANVTVTINGRTLESTGEVYRYGWDEVEADAGLTKSTLTNLGNTFTISVKDVEMALVILHAVPGLEGDFDGDNDVDGADFLRWQRDGSPNPLSQSDLLTWESNYGTTASVAAASSVTEPASACVLASGAILMLFSRRHLVGYVF